MIPKDVQDKIEAESIDRFPCYPLPNQYEADRNKFKFSAEWGYQLSQERILELVKENEVWETRWNTVADGLNEAQTEIEMLKGLIKRFWCRENPHTDFAGHTDGEKFKTQEYIWGKYAKNNL